jgi:hypothetical protein
MRDTLSRIPWIDGTLARFHLRPPAERPEGRERTLRQIREERQWQAENWDSDRFFYGLSKDDREYLYLTLAYANMSYALSLYLLFYGVVNLIWLAGYLVIQGRILGLSWADLVVGTPVLGDRSLPALLLCLLSYLAANGLYSWYIQEFESLFADWGEYNQFARRDQREVGGIAKAIWGYVSADGKAVKRAWVELIMDGVVQGRERSDEQGRFQFKDAFNVCIGRDCCLRASAGSRERQMPILIELKQVPEFTVRLDDILRRPEPSSSALSCALALWRRLSHG